MNSGTQIAVVVLFALAALFALWVVVRTWAITSARRALDRVLPTLRRELRRAQARDEKLTSDAVAHLKRATFEHTPIHELREFGASGAQWSALQRAGIETVEELSGVQNLEAIHGVGEVTAERVRTGLRRIWNEYHYDLSRFSSDPWYGAMLGAMERHAARARFVAWLGEAEERVRTLRTRLRPRFSLAFQERGAVAEASAAADEVRAHAERLLSLGLSTLQQIDQLQIREDLSPARERALVAAFAARTHLLVDQRAEVDGTENEKAFEDTRVAPWLQEAGVPYTRQLPVDIKVGSNHRTVYVDFALQRQDSVTTLIESKLSIRTDHELVEARDQARSYAFALQIRRFGVAANEGLWLFEWTVTQTEQLLYLEWGEVPDRTFEILELLGW